MAPNRTKRRKARTAKGGARRARTDTSGATPLGRAFHTLCLHLLFRDVNLSEDAQQDVAAQYLMQAAGIARMLQDYTELWDTRHGLFVDNELALDAGRKIVADSIHRLSGPLDPSGPEHRPIEWTHGVPESLQRLLPPLLDWRHAMLHESTEMLDSRDLNADLFLRTIAVQTEYQDSIYDAFYDLAAEGLHKHVAEDLAQPILAILNQWRQLRNLAAGLRRVSESSRAARNPTPPKPLGTWTVSAKKDERAIKLSLAMQHPDLVPLVNPLLILVNANTGAHGQAYDRPMHYFHELLIKQAETVLRSLR